MSRGGGGLGPVTIGALRDDHFEEVTEVLCAAFAEETLFAYLLESDAPARARTLGPLMRGMVRGHMPFCDVDVATRDGKLVGVAITARPGSFPLKARDGIGIAIKALPSFARLALSQRKVLRLATAANAMTKYHPSDRRYYYLALFGVHPSHRTGGVAQQLAHHLLARADAEQVGCYLDTCGKSTMRMCRMLGFRVQQELHPFADGPAAWGMWREPRPAGTSTAKDS